MGLKGLKSCLGRPDFTWAPEAFSTPHMISSGQKFSLNSPFFVTIARQGDKGQVNCWFCFSLPQDDKRGASRRGKGRGRGRAFIGA